MEIVGRILVGLLIFAVLGGIWFFLFNLLTGLVNFAAFGLARFTRRLFGIRGGWEQGAAAAVVATEFAKLIAAGLFWVSVFWYSFIYPAAGVVAEGSAALAFLAALAFWMPSVFFLGLFAEDLG